jgi:dihydroorotase
VQAGHCDLATLIGCLSHRPAQVLGLKAGTLETGASADFCLIDTDMSWTVGERPWLSLSRNTPWLGQMLPAQVTQTFCEGRETFNLSKHRVPGR